MRLTLAAALERIKLDPQLQSILLAWHIETNYHIEVNGCSRTIPVSRGVRQGCTSAPLLWSAIMVLLLDNLQQHIPIHWILEHITIYADDIHVFCDFRNEEELRDAVRYFEAVIHSIEQLGLTLSPSKSCVILQGKGAGFLKWKKDRIKRLPQKQYGLLLCDSALHIPIMKKCLYLGAVISYDDFQKQTVELRVRAGWNNFRRLQPWLCKKHHVSLKMRLHLMRTCIIPTICYGIFYIGLTNSGIDLVVKTFHMMYRRILGHVPHLTQLRTCTVLDTHRICHPVLTLHQLVDQAHQSLSLALTRVPMHDILHCADWTSLELTRTLLTARLEQSVPTPLSDPEAPPLVCCFCSFTTTHASEMQRHYTVVHSRPRVADTKIDFAKDTTDGKPACQYCKKIFQSWSSFKTHRKYNMCHAILSTYTDDTDMPPPLPAIQEQLLAPMEVSNAHAALLARAQVYAAEADYDSVMHDRPLCDFLKDHCILCSKHVVSLRSLTSHLRANHPGQMQEAIALGIQRTTQHTGNLSPCRLCNMEFKRTHLCPVTTQIAVLEMQAASPDDPRHHTCFLCQFVAPDRLQLRQHLSDKHKFPCFDWIPARDCLPDQVTCAHCGSVYHSIEVVRKHIIYGHCRNFDSSRPWTKNGEPEMVEHLRIGRLDQLLADAEMRRKLTLQCQFCSQKFVQACNLIHHLANQHSEIAAEADNFRNVLQQRYAPRGCYCMPAVRSVKQNHQCVAFWQLSMMHFNGNHLLSVPLSYDDRACSMMVSHVPLPSINLVHDCLQTRDFALLQQDPGFMQALRTRCLCCGKHVTLTGPVQDHVLLPHLQMHHAEPRHIIQCLIQMVIYRKQHDHLKFCDWCGVTITPVDANTEYDDHLAECPVLLHFATWLSIPFLTRYHGSDGRGRPHADVGGVGQFRPGLRGTKRPLDEEKKGPTLKDLFAKKRDQGGCDSKAHASDGTASTSTRAGHDGSAIPKQFCDVPGNDQRGHDGTFDSRKCSLEESTAEQSGDHAITTAPVSISAEDLDPKGDQTEDLQSGRSTMAIESAVPTPVEGWELAFSDLECNKEVSGTGWQSQEHTHGRDGDALGTAASHVRAAGSDHQIPLSSEQNQGCSSNPLEVGDRHEKQQTVQPDPSTGGQHGLAIDFLQNQKASPCPITIGGRADEIDPSILQREKLCLRLMELTLGNDDVQCYVNTVFLTVWWIHLLCWDFNIETWGEWTGRHQNLLLIATSNPLCIRSHPFFRDVFQQWENLRAHGQQDYGEFLCFYLGWLGTTLVSQAYQRRFLTDESGVVTAEKNVGFAPILLHSDLWQDDPMFPKFQAIVDRWTQMNGMTTALVIASKLVCFQVCRFQSMTASDRTTFDFEECEIYLTVFTNTGMDTARMPYRIVALVGYTGDSWRGHYTCVISFCNSYGESRWLFHDDNKPPQVWTIIPEWYMWTITHVWLVRKDLYHGWVQPPGTHCSPETRAKALEEVLAGLM